MNPQFSKSRIRITLTISIIVNLFITISAITIGYFTNFQTIMLDGIHSLTDFFSDVLLICILPLAYKEKDYNHSYGHARYEDIVSLLVGALIIWAAVPFLNNAYQAIMLGKHTQQPTLNQWAWGITIATIIAKEILYHITLKVGKSTNSPMLIANAIHHRSDVFSSLLVLFVLIGTKIGWSFLDIYISLMMGLYLMYSGLNIMWESIHILTDRTPSEQLTIIENILEELPNVYGFHDLRLRQSGSFIMGEVHLELDPVLTIVEAHDIIKTVQISIRQHIPNLRYFTIHIDPYKK